MATSVSAIVTESVQMAGAAFASSSVTVTGETAPVVEATIAAGVTNPVVGIAFPYDKCAMIYLLSDQTDVTVTFTNSGTSITIALTAGVPYLVFTAARVAALLLRDVLTMTVENLSTTAGVANAVSTDFHARFVLTD